MATRMELPTKREYSGEKEKEQEAGKKAKREEEESKGVDEIMSGGVEESKGVDEIMSDSFAEEEAAAQFAQWVKMEGNMEEVSKEIRRKAWEQQKLEEQLRSKCRALEYKIFFRAYVDPNRADQISSEEDAHWLFTDEEKEMFETETFRKNWHMRPTPDDLDLDDYQRLAVYYSKSDPFYLYANPSLHKSYEFDCNYLKFTRDVDKTIQWDTTSSEARATAEQIWKKYISDDVNDDVNMMLLDDCVFDALTRSADVKSGEEYALLFVDIFRREANGETFMQALDSIVKEQELDHYPLNKHLIEEALQEEKKGYPKTLINYNHRLNEYMKKFTYIQRGKTSPEDDSRVEQLIGSFCHRAPFPGNDYIHYIKKKNSVARELKILKDDQVLE